MASIIRPGSRTANSIIRRQEDVAGGVPMQSLKWWIQRVRFSNFTSAATAQTLDINATFTGNDFPAGVFICPGAYLDLVQVFAGGAVTAVTLQLGHSTGSQASDPDAFTTATNVWTGATLGPIVTPSAAEYPDGNYESGMLPTVTLTTTTANVNVLLTGIVDVYIPYNIRPSARGA